MKKHDIITNATPIIALAKIGQFHLLSQLFGKVYVPKAVYEEVTNNNQTNHYGEQELQEAIRSGSVHLYEIQNQSLVDGLIGRMHQGEVETIVGAKELDLKFVLIDERTARIQAKQFFKRPIGTVGVLILAKKAGIIAEVKPLLNQLIKHGFRMSKSLYQKVLEEVRE